MDDRLNKLEDNLSELSKEVVELKALLSTGLQKVSNNFAAIIKEVGIINNKIDLANKNIETLKGNTDGGFEVVGLKLDNLSDEISKIGAVTNYDEQYKNLEGLN